MPRDDGIRGADGDHLRRLLAALPDVPEAKLLVNALEKLPPVQKPPPVGLPAVQAAQAAVAKAKTALENSTAGILKLEEQLQEKKDAAEKLAMAYHVAKEEEKKAIQKMAEMAPVAPPAPTSSVIFMDQILDGKDIEFNLGSFAHDNSWSPEDIAELQRRQLQIKAAAKELADSAVGPIVEKYKAQKAEFEQFITGTKAKRRRVAADDADAVMANLPGVASDAAVPQQAVKCEKESDKVLSFTDKVSARMEVIMASSATKQASSTLPPQP